MLFRNSLILAVTRVMKGRKCDCVGCNCHYGKADAEKLVDAIAPIIVEECTKSVHDDLKTRLKHLKAAVVGEKKSKK